ncbi:TIGR02679 family protein [Tahibacter soli]|uniref:TIGR02679 family protein n=1 Tax=Tahibacter soli TaxID=2983605 RepID=A0A9X4BIW6_9GAMM|nr:TIGR02679 family protein [Tahibacter soli]MDC8014441.1 TIGR02679 family protein [Tahibacter soli]
MNGAGSERLERLLGGDALAGLRKRLRRRFEDDAMPATLRIGNLSDAEHAALAALTGRPSPYRRSLNVDVAAVDTALAATGIAASLRDALERLDGPIVSRSALRTSVELRWRRVFEAPASPLLAALLAGADGRSVLRRLAQGDGEYADRLRDDADRVLRQLPQAGTARALLAAQTLGDAHALDNGRSIATLVLAALRLRHGAPPEAEVRSRELWAGAGVLVNELARPALFLNLPVLPDRSGDGRRTRYGAPDYIALRELVRTPPRWNVRGVDLYVCENPNIVAIAADRLGDRCAPLVCTDGMPAAAQRVLLAQLAAAGARLFYHGDFDWPGLHIGNFVMRTFAARPWRFTAADYREALSGLPGGRTELGGAAVAASWDDELSAAMATCRIGVPEEAIADVLAGDLATA